MYIYIYILIKIIKLKKIFFQMATNSKRIHQLNKQMIFNGGKYILYIMRCIRQKSSPALTFSCKRANLLNVPVISAFFYDYRMVFYFSIFIFINFIN